MFIGIGFFLEMIAANFSRSFHPAALTARLVKRLEAYIFSLGLFAHKENTARLLSAIFAVLAVCLSGWAIIRVSALVSPFLAAAAEILFVYAAVETGRLGGEARKVYQELEEGNKKTAEGEIINATVGSLAINTAEGIIAPLFYIFLGGPALGIGYLVLRILASELGREQAGRREPGGAAAGFYAAVNWLPSRLTGLIMPMAGAMCGKDGRKGYIVYNRDKKKLAGSNDGYPLAAMAGVLGIRLAVPRHNTSVGDPLKEPDETDILAAARIMRMTAILGLAVFYVIALKLGKI